MRNPYKYSFLANVTQRRLSLIVLAPVFIVIAVGAALVEAGKRFVEVFEEYIGTLRDSNNYEVR